MTGRTHECDERTTEGRLRKAEQFLEAAELIRELADDESEVGDVYATLCGHAGIAAADTICCIDLGRHAAGDDHNQAVQLLSRVKPHGGDLGKSLRALLALKTRAGYSHRRVNAQDRTRAGRHASKLVRAAVDRQRRM